MTVQVTRLPSGLSVVTDRMAHLETASLGVWMASGSRNEKPDEHGISHLLEHMAFKGTKRRTARQIAEAIEAVGGDLNAATSVESTGYFARVLKAGKKYKRGLGRMVTDIGGGIAEAKQGWDLICYHGDAWLLQVAIRQGIDGIRAGVRAKGRKGAK